MQVGISEPAPAKVNLHLHVTGRRDDGYHLLDSLVVFTKLGDTLSAAAADDLTLAVNGPNAAALGETADEDNLVLRAARALAAAAGIEPRAAITLEKTLPVAAGIGGGSADAAATLRLLSRLWHVTLPAEEMHAIAAGLGADVPACLQSRPLVLGGIGEQLTPLGAPLPSCALLLVNPRVPVSTPAVFAARKGPYSPPAPFADTPHTAAGLAAALRQRQNDLEAPARHLAPVIAEVLTALDTAADCLLARMSGSGATCFGLFATLDQAKAAERNLTANHPDWWCTATGLNSPVRSRPCGARSRR
jgi:4-diphosphocytidyl-2-C-methyl-D-erythritol kinase